MRARDNPFTSDRMHALRFRPQGTTWAELLARLEQLGWRGAIVGPQGSGKTTLLLEMAERLRERGFRPVLWRARDRWPAGPFRPDDFLLVDSAEVLGRWRWWSFRWKARHAGGLVITAHRVGLLPTLIDCRTSPQLLGEVIGEILGGDDKAKGIDVGRLFTAHGGNIRSALRSLYDRGIEAK